MSGQERIRAVFVRGGTSRALVFRPDDLPPPGEARDRIFLAALGGPDPYGRQLDGLGGGSSSTSKVAIIGASTRPGVDVDYTFAQVDVTRPRVDYRGNCGNISSAVGPYAIEEGLARGPVVTFLNTNTGKLIRATVPLDAEGMPAVAGDFLLPGVPGRGARIALEFLDPGGAVTGKLLPTGSARDVVAGVEASLVDATNPMVFVRASDLGLTGAESPEVLDRDQALASRLEAIRAEATVRMGITPDAASATERSPAVPKIALVAPPSDRRDAAGGAVAAEDVDLLVLLVSMGRFHRAVALTGAMCLAVAAQVPGTLVAEVARPIGRGADVRIGHPSGILAIAAEVEVGPAGPRALATRVYRTARRLMEGYVRVPGAVLTDPDPFADRLSGALVPAAD